MLDDTPIRRVNKINILGLNNSDNGSNADTIKLFRTSVQNTASLIKRISNRHRGMREADTRHLIQAFCLCRITYSISYLYFSLTEIDQLNRLIRNAYKTALHLPKSTATDKLLQLGVHNTLGELVEAHLFSQYQRLSLTETGQVLLRRIGINVPGHTTATHEVPVTVSSNLLFPPLPKNTHPEHNRARREARAKSLQKRFPPSSPAVYADAAEYVDHRAFVVAVVDGFQKLIASASLPNSTESLEAEEAAIALAIVHSSAEYIFSDSKTAIRNFATFRIHSPAAKILESSLPPDRLITLLWVPAHCGHPGNTAAHTQARALANRAHSDLPSLRNARDRLLSYHDITLCYRNSRLTYPPPHKSLSRCDQALWRRLQTATVTTPFLLSLFTHGETSHHCNLCPSTRADFQHIFLNCPNKPKPPWQGSEHQERWEAALRSSQPGLQLRTVSWARRVAEAQSCPAT
ncbi:uncharacterized protein LOC142772065 isoform X1 [Rhipicephalus microplus]|uniref:uncharacterized protein LOC142772065 isoform X1 n=1 Tax=Rhipicephalus microplus TaxID=6941 RepID=UPI003F6C3D27